MTRRSSLIGVTALSMWLAKCWSRLSGCVLAKSSAANQPLYSSSAASAGVAIVRNTRTATPARLTRNPRGRSISGVSIRFLPENDSRRSVVVCRADRRLISDCDQAGQGRARPCPPPVFRVPECKGSLESMEPKRLTGTTATDEVVGRSGGSCGCPAAGGPSTPGAPGGSFGEPYVGDQPLCGLDGEFGEAGWTALEDPASRGQVDRDTLQTLIGFASPARVRQHLHRQGEHAESSAGAVTRPATGDFQVPARLLRFGGHAQNQSQTVGDTKGQQQAPRPLGNSHLQLQAAQPQVRLEVPEAVLDLHPLPVQGHHRVGGQEGLAVRSGGTARRVRRQGRR